MDSSAGLESRVVAILRDAVGVEPPARDTDLLDSGLLDSLGVVSLISEIESAFGMELPLDELDVDDFRSIDRIVALLTPGDENAA